MPVNWKGGGMGVVCDAGEQKRGRLCMMGWLYVIYVEATRQGPWRWKSREDEGKVLSGINQR